MILLPPTSAAERFEGRRSHTQAHFNISFCHINKPVSFRCCSGDASRHSWDRSFFQMFTLCSSLPKLARMSAFPACFSYKTPAREKFPLEGELPVTPFSYSPRLLSWLVSLTRPDMAGLSPSSSPMLELPSLSARLVQLSKFVPRNLGRGKWQLDASALGCLDVQLHHAKAWFYLA